MQNLLVTVLASVPTVTVPDSGTTIAIVSGGILSVGLLARFLKNRKK
jgi:hypothetical protein